MNRRRSVLGAKGLSKIFPQKKQSTEDTLFKNFEFNPLVNSELIIESFKIFDENRTDDLDRKEFKKLMIALGTDKTDKEINDLYNKVDTDKSGTIDLNEFNSMMLHEHFNKNAPVHYILETCFDLYDKDNDGFISVEDLMKVGDEFEEYTLAEELLILIRLLKEFSLEAGLPMGAEPDKISKEEFINSMIRIQFVREIENKDKQGENKNNVSNNIKNSNSNDSNGNISDANIDGEAKRDRKLQSQVGSSDKLKVNDEAI